MAAYFYYDDNTAERKGPFNETQLKILAGNGSVRRDTVLETENGHRGTAGQLNWLEFGLTLDDAKREEQGQNPVQQRAIIAITVAFLVLAVIGSGAGVVWHLVSRSAAKTAVRNVMEDLLTVQKRHGNDEERRALLAINVRSCPKDFQNAFEAFRSAALKLNDSTERVSGWNKRDRYDTFRRITERYESEFAVRAVIGEWESIEMKIERLRLSPPAHTAREKKKALNEFITQFEEMETALRRIDIGSCPQEFRTAFEEYTSSVFIELAEPCALGKLHRIAEKYGYDLIKEGFNGVF